MRLVIIIFLFVIGTIYSLHAQVITPYASWFIFNEGIETEDSEQGKLPPAWGAGIKLTDLRKSGWDIGLDANIVKTNKSHIYYRRYVCVDSVCMIEGNIQVTDTLIKFTNSKTAVIWKVSLEPVYRIIDKKSIQFAAGFNIGFAMMNKSSNTTFLNFKSESKIRQHYLPIGLVARMHWYPHDRVGIMLAINPSFLKSLDGNCEDCNYIPYDLPAFQAQAGISYRLRIAGD